MRERTQQQKLRTPSVNDDCAAVGGGHLSSMLLLWSLVPSW